MLNSRSSWWLKLKWGIVDTSEAILATQQLLHSSQYTIHAFAHKGRPIHRPSKLLDAINYAQEWLNNEFDRIVTNTPVHTQAQNHGADLDSRTRLHLRLLQKHCRSVQNSLWRSPSDDGAVTFTTDLDADIRLEIDQLYPVLSCVSRVEAIPTENIRVLTKPWSISLPQRCKRYENAQYVIGSVLGNIPLEEPNLPLALEPLEQSHSCRSALLQGFPGSHIAYLNRDHEAAIYLWTNSGFGNHPRDILGRTLTHLGVATNSLDILTKIAQDLPGEPIANLAQDAFGLSPHDITVILDNTNTFNHLQGQLTKHELAPHVLNLAIDADSSSIIAHVLKVQLVQPPFGDLMRRAIECGSIKTADIFMPSLQIRELTSRNDVLELAVLAENKGLHDLAVQLRGIYPAFTSPEEGLLGVDAAEHFHAEFSARFRQPEYLEPISATIDADGARFSQGGMFLANDLTQRNFLG